MLQDRIKIGYERCSLSQLDTVKFKIELKSGLTLNVCLKTDLSGLALLKWVLLKICQMTNIANFILWYYSNCIIKTNPHNVSISISLIGFI